MTPRITLALAIVASALLATPASAAVHLTEIGTFDVPVYVTSPPADPHRLFVVEKNGHIELVRDGVRQAEPFLDIRGPVVANGEQGLLSMAFAPDYATSRRFYVYYTAPGTAGGSVITVEEWRTRAGNPDAVDPGSRRVLLEIDHPSFTNHNGGQLQFAPDGGLYAAPGDGGGTSQNAQDPNARLGKLLRIDPATGVVQIWASGLRNPWRCSFDTGGSKELFCADVGQNAYEEVDIITKGGNYGWRVREGKHCFDYVNPNTHPATCESSGMIDPILEYKNCNVTADCKGLSITGGYVYRGSHGPWQGKYFFGDWSTKFGVKDGRLYVATNSGGAWTMEDVKVSNMPGFNSYVLGFGQDADGEVYVTTQDTTGPVGGLAKVYKIAP
jgi:glucose/arabinose dehydrogenase